MPRLRRRISGVEQAAFRTRARRAAGRPGRALPASARAWAWASCTRAVNRLASRLSLRTLRRQVPDPRLRDKLTPRYAMGCKRVLISNDYCPSLTRAERRRGHRRHRSDRAGRPRHRRRRPAPGDTIIFGTGFHVTDSAVAAAHPRPRRAQPGATRGQPSMHAYRGTTVAGFPNLFFLLGPNTGLGHTSVVLMIEAQLRPGARGPASHAGHGHRGPSSPPRGAQRRWTERVDQKMAGTVWADRLSRAGTSTAPAATPPSGRASPPASGCGCAGSARPTTRSPRPEHPQRPEREHADAV